MVMFYLIFNTLYCMTLIPVFEGLQCGGGVFLPVFDSPFLNLECVIEVCKNALGVQCYENHDSDDLKCSMQCICFEDFEFKKWS